MFSPVVFLAVSLILFSCGVTVVLIKKNAIIILIGIELMLNAANLNLVGFNQLYPTSQHGQVFTLFVIVVAAAEAAVALAIILKVYQFYQTAQPDDIHELGDK
ncbi:MAG: NADH-quinone oxidoreductase subunit NuoK [Thalassobius sp.]|nr:NADH-quinone oxidoreductase subunit NuoK [Thalassovita sp.]